jgi:hypothetical protein
MTRKIVPLKMTYASTYVAPGVVLRVFDTNAAGELLPVAFRRNPIDAVEVQPVDAPHGQLWAEIALDYYKGAYMTDRMVDKQVMIDALQARQKLEAPLESEEACFHLDAASQFGFEMVQDEPELWQCTRDQLVTLANAFVAGGHFQYARRAGHSTDQALEILNRPLQK